MIVITFGTANVVVHNGIIFNAGTGVGIGDCKIGTMVPCSIFGNGAVPA